MESVYGPGLQMAHVPLCAFNADISLQGRWGNIDEPCCQEVREADKLPALMGLTF